MNKALNDFITEEDGLGTVEIVLIIAVLVGLALLFKKHIVAFVAKIMGGVVDNSISTKEIEDTAIK